MAAKPYDVLSSEEARKEAGTKPLSFLHVTKPEIDLPTTVDHYDERVYSKGKENLNKLIAGGVLHQDGQPCFYLYALTMESRVQYGLVGCVSSKEYENNTIRKHELTRPDKENDRARHIQATNAQTGPVFLTYRKAHEIDSLVDQLANTKPEYDFTTDDGVRHQVWVIADQKSIDQIEEMFCRVQYLYIADGHHRSAAAARVAKGRNDESNYFLAVIVPHDQVRILEYNRVVKDLNGLTLEALLGGMSKQFDVRQSSLPARPAHKGEFGMYVKQKWFRFTARPELLSEKDTMKVLDVSILQNHLLNPLLGIDDQRTNKKIDFVGGIRGLRELERRVDSGEMAVAFSLYPTSIDELMTIADAGEIMPPKSTWFEPKLRDGVLVHLLS